ncbi:hypothetical protein F2Q68_00019371 [Brassica cretica]|uniref:Flavin-containing monooxygenase n=1 Tax=Brassica cretica TaxID=69181 RepID=A0A8S9G472_BRACR|nr:hypothetical protein F2Q68_00019371 [Brassica cretica]
MVDSSIIQMAPSIKCRHVAVIGAGAAGLVAARELRREGHSVVVFERQNQVGGTWIYTDHVEQDPLSVDPTRPIVYSSVYRSLRTYLPRECMGFIDFPFAKEFAIEEMIRFETAVERVSPAEESDGEGGITKWRIEFTEKEEKVRRPELYDAVVVCNGHYIEPRLADIPGISSWPGKEMHYHNYRIPEPFKEQVVVRIGSSASAVDISRDIAGVAKEVHVASWSNAADTFIKQNGHTNLWVHSMLSLFSVFRSSDSFTIEADAKPVMLLSPSPNVTSPSLLPSGTVVSSAPKTRACCRMTVASHSRPALGISLSPLPAVAPTSSSTPCSPPVADAPAPDRSQVSSAA